MSNTPFFTRSVKIAESFLQTAVVVDDRAFTQQSEAGPFKAQAPSGPDDTRFLVPLEEWPRDVPSPPDAHGIDPHEVIDGFAKLGIVCAVLARNADDTLENHAGRLRRLVDIADILVVDWHVHSPDGTTESYEETLKLIEEIVASNQDASKRQLRLIAVYTGELSLSGVGDKIAERFPEFARLDDYSFNHNAVRVVVLGKRNGRRVAVEQRLEANFSELGIKTVEEFSRMTAGLVSNVALETLDRLRRATHKVITKFGPSLDAAFLVHRAFNDPPEEADEQLMPLIADELQAVMESKRSTSIEDSLEDWLAERQSTHDTWRKNKFDSAQEESEALKELLSKGYKQAHDKLKKSIEGLDIFQLESGTTQLDQIANLVSGDADVTQHQEMAMLMSVKSRYSNLPPPLSLGTIVMSEEKGSRNFWLCLQPLCDCVRLKKKKHYFPMLRLSKPGDASPFGIVVKVDGEFVKLRCRPSPPELRSIEFLVNKDSQAVISVFEDGRFMFETSDGLKCRWIADLKFEHAQRAVNQFANQNSRVGLIESEWLRRWSK